MAKYRIGYSHGEKCFFVPYSVTAYDKEVCKGVWPVPIEWKDAPKDLIWTWVRNRVMYDFDHNVLVYVK